MSNLWKPWSREQVAELVTAEIVSLTEPDLVALSPSVVALEPFATADGPGSDGQSYWLVAKDGDRVLYWDSVEEEFGTGMLKGAVLSDAGTFGEKLAWALKHFLEGRVSG